MDISNVNAATPASAATGNTLATNDVEEQFNNFLNLLTAQIKNQDPLSPLDSTQFVEQLATFTGLEQQVQTNNYLANMTSLLGEFVGAMASQWVGETVEIESSFVPVDGAPVNFTADIPAEADNAVFVVWDRNGDTLYSEQLDPSDPNWTWDGKLADGTQVPADVYQVGIEIYQDNQFVGTLAPRLITEVTQASLEDGRVRLGFENHLTGYADDVRKTGS